MQSPKAEKPGAFLLTAMTLLFLLEATVWLLKLECCFFGSPHWDRTSQFFRAFYLRSYTVITMSFILNVAVYGELVYSREKKNAS